MDEPTERQPIVPGDPSGDRPLPLPIGARSTVHPWEEPPILPAPSMFHAAPPTPARGRHARRSRPAGLVSAAAAASVLLVGGSAVAMLSLAASTPGQPPAGAATGGPRAAGGQSQVAAAPSPSDSAGVAAGLQPARYAQTHGPAPTTWFRPPQTTPHGAPVSAGSGSTAISSARGVLSSSPTTTSTQGGPGSSVRPSTGTGGWTRIPWSGPTASHPPVVPPAYRPPVVPSAPSGSSSEEPTASVPSAPHTDQPAPKPAQKPTRHVPVPRPSHSHPHPQPVPVQTHSQPAPDPSESEPPASEPSTGEPSASGPSASDPSGGEPASPPVMPSPSHTDSGLHKALGHAIDPPGRAVGHSGTPARPHRELVTPTNPVPTASGAE